MYAALKQQLPAGWTAWHSLRIRTSTGVEGEGDFVFAIPDCGFLVLEVKGGRIEVQDGRWLQNSLPMERTPREQALGFAHLLNDRLKEQGCPSVPFAVLTLFPDTAFSVEPQQDNLRGLTLGQQDVPWLIESIRAKLDRVFPENFVVPRCNWSAMLHHLWGETWVPKFKLGQKARQVAEDRIMLDNEQIRLIDCLSDNKLLLIEGVAGSGKTIIAREAAIKKASEGKRVLYLCYTDALAQWLRSNLEEAGVEVWTVPRYAVELLKQHNMLEDLDDSADFWSQVSFQAAIEALPLSLLPPDVVILDEAQDLTDSDWLLVEELAKGKVCWIFQDPAQAFWDDRPAPSWIKDQGLFRLTKSYRCPASVIELSKKYTGEPFESVILDSGFEDGILGIINAPSETSIPAKIENEINKLRSEGFQPQDIAVISLRGQNAEDGVARANQIGSIPVVRSDDPAMESNVVAETFLRFKGLERPAIIITDSRLVKDRMDVRMHIALTRATDVVRVVKVVGQQNLKAPRPALYP